MTVRKLPKHLTGNPLLNKAEREAVLTKAATDLNAGLAQLQEPKKPPRRKETLAYALVKPQTPDGLVTLPQLAAERGMQPQLARIWVKNAKVKKPGTRWQLEKKSKALARVRKVLGLT